MAMGVRYFPLDISMRTRSTLRILSAVVLFFIFCISSAEGRSTQCRVDECTESYNQATIRLETAEKRSPTTDFSKRRCNVQKRLHRCLHRTRRACRGDLLFHSLQHLSNSKLETANCSSSRKIQLSNVDIRSTASSLELRHSGKNTTLAPPSLESGSAAESSHCSFVDEPVYKHCGMFGDPHLRTFSDRFYTCSVEKTWPLIDNDYMVVMATNVRVRKGLKATVTTKITVLVKSAGKCADQRHYVATSDGLPGAFSDGSSATGSVYVVEIEEGKHVEIQARFIATTVIIRRVAGYLTFAIRVPEVLVTGEASKPQLCVHGCPLEHRIAPSKQMNQDKVNTPQLLSPSSETQDVSKPLIRSHTKRASNANTPMTADSIAEISEKDARKLCKRIILGKTEGIANEDDRTVPESRQSNTSSSKTPKSISSISSVAFSSLVPSSSRKHKKRGKRKNRMAPASKPETDISRSSFHRLLAMQDETKDAILSSQSLNPIKRKRKQKSKRDVSKQIENTVEDIVDPDCVDVISSDEFSDFNFYFDSCVFDLMTTGDTNFTFSAKAALQDLMQTHVLAFDAPGASISVVKCWTPKNLKTKHPTDSSEDNSKTGGNGTSPKSISMFLLFLCVAFSCFCVDFLSILSISSSGTVSTALQKSCDEKLRNLNRETKSFFNVVTSS